MKSREEEKASGIAPDKLSDIEKAMEEIIAKFEEIEQNATKEKKEKQCN